MIGRSLGRWFLGLGLGAVCLFSCSPDGAKGPRPDAPPERAGLGDGAGRPVHASGVLGAARQLASPDPGLVASLRDRESDLKADGGAHVSKGWRAPVLAGGISGIAAKLPASADEPFVIRQSVWDARRLDVALEGARRQRAELVEGRVVYRDLYPSTDAVWLADDWKVEELLVLRDDGAPRSFSWKVSLGSGVAGARPDPDGGLSFVDAGGETVFHVPRPFALDARGERRDAALAWAGDRLTVSLDSAGLTHPILLDPVVEGVWQNLAPSNPPSPGRQATNMAYDTARSRSVFFGGISSSGYHCDTWELGRDISGPWGWAQLFAPSSCPTTAGTLRARAQHATAWDTTNQRTLIFGGFIAGDSLPTGELWMLETGGGSPTWVQCIGTCSTAVPGRYNTAMTFDTARGVAVVFGGLDGVTLNPLCDTWEWSSSSESFTLRQNPADCTNGASTANPTGRHGMAMAYDQNRGVTVLYGGDTAAGLSSQLWEYNHSNFTWGQRCTTAPCSTGTKPGVLRHARMAYDSAIKRIVLYGGENAISGANGIQSGVWLWDGTNWTSLGSVSGPPGRRNFAMAYDSTERRTIAFGGQLFGTGANDNGTWALRTHGNDCNSNADCDTNYCVTDTTVVSGQDVDVPVCCETACTGRCQACTTAVKQGGGPDGVCGPALAGTDPHADCTDQGATSCGTNGNCDGSGECQYYPGSTQCAAASCSGSTFIPARNCNFGSHTCPPPNPQTCNGYICQNATSCRTACTQDTHCASGFFCSSSGACEDRRTQGSACAYAECYMGGTCAICTSAGGCVDGRCCNTACGADCQKCDGSPAGSTPGTCAAVLGAAGTGTPDAPQCTGSQTCSPSGACLKANGQTETSGSNCASGHASDGVCCDTACTGSCNACTQALGAQTTGTCRNLPAGDPGVSDACEATGYLCNGSGACPTSCSSDSACAADSYCNTAGQCVDRLQQGASCNATTDCIGGGDCRLCEGTLSCEDGVCCNDSSCGESPCRACTTAIKGSGDDGFCGPIAPGTDPRNRCAADTTPNSCLADGWCDGSGSCRPVSPSSRPCGTTSCNQDGVSVDGRVCDGAGSCQTVTGRSCTPFRCNSGDGSCATFCTSDTDCAAGAFCTTGTQRVCQNKFGLGAECGGNNECNSNYCVDGRCCSGACNTACRSCGNGDGTCTTVVRNEEDDNCDGTRICDADGACKLKQTSGGCMSNAECVTGRCVDGHCCADSCSTPCRSCSNSNGTCTTRVTDEDDDTCDGTDTCNADGVCRKKRGQPCDEADECATGLCVDGVCCDTSCEGTCEACDVEGELGTCTLVEGDPHGARTPCDGEARSVCAGTCDGTDVDCSYPGRSEVCGSTCTGERITRRSCDGLGRCMDQAPETCGLYACDETAGVCRTSCQENAHCAASTACADNGRCISAGASCLDLDTLRDAEGEEIECAPYQCRVDRCLESCESIDDCVGETVCDSSGRCISRSGALGSDEEGGCGCRQGPAPPSPGRALFVIGVAALLTLRRRSRGARLASRAA